MIKCPDTPGPGVYDIKSTIGSSSAKFSIRSRQPVPTDTSEIPGPGRYDVNDSKAKKSAPSFSISGRPQTKGSQAASQPGPGDYSPEPKKGLGPKISMAPRLADTSRVDSSPGPAAYSSTVSSVKPRGPTHTISARYPAPGESDREREANPGPGAYTPGGDVGSLKKSGVVTLKSRIDTKGESFHTPGPGSYDVRPDTTGTRAPQPTIKGKYESKAKESTPAPGDYSLASTIGKAQKASISGRTPLPAASDHVPGPGQYNINETATTVKHRSPQYTMRPKTAVPAPQAAVPGPGAYSPEPPKRALAVTLKGRLPHKDKEDTPGPIYTPQPVDKTRPPAYSMASGHKPLSSSTGVPGPGAYTVPAPKVTAPTLKSRTEVKESFVDAPGPGAYDPKPKFGDGPKLSLSGRFNGSSFIYANSQNTGSLHLKATRTAPLTQTLA